MDILRLNPLPGSTARKLSAWHGFADGCIGTPLSIVDRPLTAPPNAVKLPHSCARMVRSTPIRCTTDWKSPRLLTGGFLDDSDLVLRQVVQLVHQRVNLAVGGFDLPLVQLLIGGDGGSGELAV